MAALARLALVLVIVLVGVSAYLRLAHSGLGCTDWPACYGRIGTAQTGTSLAPVVSHDNPALSWATPLHRLTASALGMVVIFLTVVAFRQKRRRILASALLGATVYLAMLGLRSGSLHDPAVVIGNLAGGFLMLGLLGWLVFTTGPSPPLSRACPRLSAVTLFATLLLAGQILLGGLTSANFAATACQSLPGCNGSWLPGPALAKAFDLSRVHQVSPDGTVRGGEERVAIHKAHRLGAILTLAALLATGLFALRSAPVFRTVALTILLLVAVEFAVGLAAIVTQLPILLAVTHNWLAALLLLALVKLLSMTRRQT